MKEKYRKQAISRRKAESAGRVGRLNTGTRVDNTTAGNAREQPARYSCERENCKCVSAAQLVAKKAAGARCGRLGFVGGWREARTRGVSGMSDNFGARRDPHDRAGVACKRQEPGVAAQSDAVGFVAVERSVGEDGTGCGLRVFLQRERGEIILVAGEFRIDAAHLGGGYELGVFAPGVVPATHPSLEIFDGAMIDAGDADFALQWLLLRRGGDTRRCRHRETAEQYRNNET